MLIGAIVLVVGLGTVLSLWYLSSATQAASHFAVGSVDTCRKLPRFAASVGLRGTLSVSTTQPNVKGLVLSSVEKSYQHPTWDDAGTLGPFALDRDGNIYVAPVPQAAVSDIVPNSQHTIYRVDTSTGVMAPFLTVPPAAPGDETNRFGVLGLTYDCDTHSLYATTVGGSTRQNEIGQVVRIDLQSKKVIPELSQIDALGVGVYNTAKGKQLYIGSARSSEVYVTTLDAQGDASTPPRLAFSFGDHDAYGNARVRRFSFADPDALQVTTVPFAFNLRAGSNRLQQSFSFHYDAANDTWVFQEPPPQATQ